MGGTSLRRLLFSFSVLLFSQEFSRDGPREEAWGSIHGVLGCQGGLWFTRYTPVVVLFVPF